MKNSCRTLFFALLTSICCKQAVAGTSAQLSCWPSFTSMNLDIESLNSSLMFTYESQNVEGNYPTNVQGSLEWDDGNLILNAKYANGWGLPFVISSVMVFKEDQLIHFDDYTNGCRSPGINMLPGDYEELFRLKVKGKPLKNIRLIIWARQ